MRSRFLSSAALLACSCVLHTSAARADSFLFTATGTGLNLTATLTGVADSSVAGAYDITGGFGLANGIAITVYTPSGTATVPQTANFTSPPFTYDSTYTYNNVVYTSGNGGLVVDPYGILFSETDDHLNIFAAGGNYVYSDDEIINGFDSPVSSVTLTPLASSVTPEPASIALLGTGLLGTCGLLRRRLRA